MIKLSLRKKRFHWKGPAAANFFFGGLGGGLFILYWFVSIWPAGQNHAAASSYVGLICAGLVVLGFASVSLEAGRPMKGLFLFLNFSEAWMSREIVFGCIFILFATAQYYYHAEFLQYVAAFFAILFVVSQAMILYRSSAVPTWHTWLIPVMLVSADLCAGYGAALALGFISLPMLICGISIIGFHMFLSVFYMRRIKAEFTKPDRRQPGVFKILLREDAAGLWLPLCWSLLMLSGILRAGSPASVACGLLVVGGTGFKIHAIVCKHFKVRQMTIDKPAPESIV
jgi:hypothetical protein